MRGMMLLLVAALALTACGNIRPVGTPQGGVVTPILGNGEQQLVAAQEHCAQYRKNARLSQALGTGSITFDCTR